MPWDARAGQKPRTGKETTSFSLSAFATLLQSNLSVFSHHQVNSAPTLLTAFKSLLDSLRILKLVASPSIMSAETSELTKVDSAVSGLSSSPPADKKHRRASSSATGVYNINDLGELSSVLTWVQRNRPVPPLSNKADSIAQRRKVRSCR